MLAATALACATCMREDVGVESAHTHATLDTRTSFGTVCFPLGSLGAGTKCGKQSACAVWMLPVAESALAGRKQAPCTRLIKAKRCTPSRTAASSPSLSALSLSMSSASSPLLLCLSRPPLARAAACSCCSSSSVGSSRAGCARALPLGTKASAVIIGSRQHCYACELRDNRHAGVTCATFVQLLA